MFFSALVTGYLTLCSASPTFAWPEKGSDIKSVQRAVYFLDNDPSGASVISLNIASDGTLSNPVRTSTGGTGSLAKWVIPNPPDDTGFAGPDSLFSANAVVVSGNFLFVVNAGSNTLSLFTINPSNPQKPVLTGKPANTLGDFPISVTYSQKLNIACVLNGGAKSGVACFSVDKIHGLVAIDSSLRSISQAINQSTPPAGPISTASDIMFNPSSTALFVTTKGVPPSDTASAVLGFIYAWPVVGNRISTVPTISQPNTVILDFSLTFLGTDNSILLTDAVGEAYILSVSSNLEVAIKHNIILPANEGLACWGVYVPSLDNAYIMSASITNISIANASTGTLKGAITLPASDQGSFDSAADRTFLYSLTNVASIAVVDLITSPPKVIQNLDLSALGSRKGWQGLAIYSSS